MRTSAAAVLIACGTVIWCLPGVWDMVTYRDRESGGRMMPQGNPAHRWNQMEDTLYDGLCKALGVAMIGAGTVGAFRDDWRGRATSGASPDRRGM